MEMGILGPGRMGAHGLQKVFVPRAAYAGAEQFTERMISVMRNEFDGHAIKL